MFGGVDLRLGSLGLQFRMIGRVDRRVTGSTERLAVTDAREALKGRKAPGGVGEGHNESESKARHSNTV